MFTTANLRGLTALPIVVLCCLAPARGSVVELLPPGQGSDASFAQSVHPDGRVAGFCTAGGAEVAVVWRAGASGYEAQSLPAPAGWPLGGANSISFAGHIVGYAQPDDLSTASAVVWSPSGASYLPTLLGWPAGAALTAAYSINSSGHVAGFSQAANGIASAIAWQPGGYANPILLPAARPNQTESVAAAVNDDGDVAGYTLGPGGLQGAVWIRSGNSYTPHTVISGGSAVITAMNLYGTGAGVYVGNRPLVMVYYEGEFYAMNLPMPGGATDGASNSVNNFDAIVGYAKDPDTETFGPEAALWLPTETQWEYTNLDRWLDEVDPAQGVRWTLTDALSLSDTWLVAGAGLYDPDGQGPEPPVERGFVLDASSLVPEPSCAQVLGAGLLRRRMREG